MDSTYYVLWRLPLLIICLCSITHYDITIGNDIARDAHCDITMGNSVARGIHYDITISNDVAKCSYIPIHNHVAVNLFHFVLRCLLTILLFH